MTNARAMRLIVKHLNGMEPVERWAFIRWIYERYEVANGRPISQSGDPVPPPSSRWEGYRELRRLRGSRTLPFMADLLREMWGLPVSSHMVARWESGLTKPQERYRAKLEELLAAFKGHEAPESATSVAAVDPVGEKVTGGPRATDLSSAVSSSTEQTTKTHG